MFSGRHAILRALTCQALDTLLSRHTDQRQGEKCVSCGRPQCVKPSCSVKAEVLRSMELQSDLTMRISAFTNGLLSPNMAVCQVGMEMTSSL